MNLFELYNMRKIFGAYRFNLLYDRLAGGFRKPDLGASLDHEVLLSFIKVIIRNSRLGSTLRYDNEM